MQREVPEQWTLFVAVVEEEGNQGFLFNIVCMCEAVACVKQWHAAYVFTFSPQATVHEWKRPGYFGVSPYR